MTKILTLVTPLITLLIAAYHDKKKNMGHPSRIIRLEMCQTTGLGT